MFRVQSPNAGRRANYPNFYNYDEDVDDDEDLFEHRHPSEYENPLGRLREVNSVFRSMGTPVGKQYASVSEMIAYTTF